MGAESRPDSIDKGFGELKDRLELVEYEMEKLKNETAMTKALGGGGSGTDGGVGDTSYILDAINKIGDNIRDESNKKYALADDMKKISGKDGAAGLARRLNSIEAKIGDKSKDLLIEQNRKNIKKLQKRVDDLESLPRGGSISPLEMTKLEINKPETSTTATTASVRRQSDGRQPLH